MSKLLVVFGASGNQGRSVVKAVLTDPILSKDFNIRAVTRDTSKPSVASLAESGVEIVTADLSSPTTVADAVRGAHTVFLMTNFWESLSADTEIAQGQVVADACKSAGVQYLIFSSLINASQASKGRLNKIAHFDGKAKVEQYIHECEIPATFILPGMFMSGFLDMIRKNEDGSYILALPIAEDKAHIPLFNASGDTGKFVAAVLKKHPSYVGKHVYAAVDHYTAKRLMSEFQEVIGNPSAFAQIPSETFKSFLPESIAEELLQTMLLLEEPGYYAGAELTKDLGFQDDTLTTWKAFVLANKSKWL